MNLAPSSSNHNHSHSNRPRSEKTAKESTSKGSSSRRSNKSRADMPPAFDLSRLKGSTLASNDLSTDPETLKRQANRKRQLMLWGTGVGLAVGLIVILLVLVLKKKALVAGPRTADSPNIFIPAYYFPGIEWDRIITLAPTGYLVMNPKSGPGAQLDHMYSNYVSQVKKTGIKVLGYIPVNYGSVNVTHVMEDSMTFMNWYGVDGIFLDEAPSDMGNLSYVQAVGSFLKQKGVVFVVNCGVYPVESYMEAVDMVVTFEDTFARYQSLSLPPWVFKYNASRFVHFVHDTPTDSLAVGMKLAGGRSVKNVYFTDARMPNPYNGLPAYFDQEATTVSFS
ncbi:UNVERIFIED_CONTAM: hypothetical protein HDU68_002264 [Siphonaria sp. JEL0065]|nr:hypothetical protein HDU68_002264 [Siphonaria sp. JEL0065]